LGRAILDHCRAAVAAGRVDSSAEAVTRELVGVLAMLDEVIAAEGIADWKETHVFH
jgi:hypothetical protein